MEISVLLCNFASSFVSMLLRYPPNFSDRTTLNSDLTVLQVHDWHLSVRTIICLSQMRSYINKHHEADASLSANGSTAFKWKLCCHWLKGLLHNVTFFQPGPGFHYNRSIIQNFNFNLVPYNDIGYPSQSQNNLKWHISLWHGSFSHLITSLKPFSSIEFSLFNGVSLCQIGYPPTSLCTNNPVPNHLHNNKLNISEMHRNLINSSTLNELF